MKTGVAIVGAWVAVALAIGCGASDDGGGSPGAPLARDSGAPRPRPDAGAMLLSDAGSADAGDAGALECFTPCGGDPSGFWELDHTCGRDLTGGCFKGIQSIQFDFKSQSGQYYFHDGLLSFHLSYQDDVTIRYGAACARKSSRLEPSVDGCLALERSLEATKTGPGTTFGGANCEYVPGAERCDCIYGVTEDYQAIDVSYSRSSDGLTYTTPDFPESLRYCVEGDTLTMRPIGVLDLKVDLTYVLRRVQPECAPATCASAEVVACDPFGRTPTSGRCDPGTACVGGVCVTTFCTPGGHFCTAGVDSMCTATGSGYTTTNCAATGRVCVAGVGCVQPDAGSTPVQPGRDAGAVEAGL